MIQVHIVEKYNTNRRVVFHDNFERNKVVRNASNPKEAEEFYFKHYITKDMKPESREEYQEQVKKAKELPEKGKIKEICTWFEDIQLNGGLKKEYDILQIDYSIEKLKKVTTSVVRTPL